MKKFKYFLSFSIFIHVLSLIITVSIELSFRKYIDSFFIISSLATSILLFKLILDRGSFDVFRYNWHKSKRYVFFFLPKYWNKETDDEINSFDDYIRYREERALKSLPILLFTSLINLIIAFLLSLLIFYINK